MHVQEIKSLRTIQDEDIDYAIVLVFSNECWYCKQFKPVFTDTMKNYPEYSAFVINVDNMPADEKKKVVERTGGDGVPVTLFMYNGLYNSSIRGNVSANKFRNWLDNI